MINKTSEVYEIKKGDWSEDLDIMRTIEEFDLLVAAFKEKTKKECADIELVNTNPGIMDNKLGGIPFIPIGEEIPRSKDGEFMPLIMQINLAEAALPDWPQKGILEIFGADIYRTVPNEWAVRVFDGSLQHRSEDELPQIITSITDRARGIIIGRKETYMPLNDYRFDACIKELIRKTYGDEILPCNYIDDYFEKNFDLGEHRIRSGVIRKVSWVDLLFQNTQCDITLGGYADYTQTDPRTYSKSDYTECLFKIDSCYDSAKLYIGDAGIISGIIRREDLAEGRLDKAEISWDCC